MSANRVNKVAFELLIFISALLILVLTAINIEGSGVQFNPDPRFALTREGSYGYNTTLARDLFLRLSW